MVNLNIAEIEDLISLTFGDIELGQGSNKTKLFFQYLMEGRSEEEMKRMLYGSKKSMDTHFYHLKKRATNLIVNKIITLPSENMSGHQTAFNDGYKNYAAFRMILTRGAKAIGVEIGKETVKSTQKYHINELSYLISYELMRHYALIGNERKRNYYQDIYRSSLALHLIELEIGSLFAELSTLFAKSKHLSKTEREQVYNLRNEIVDMQKDADSFRIKYFYFFSKIIVAQMENDHVETISIGKNAVTYFSKLSFKPNKITYFTFYLYQIPALICSKKYKNAEQMIDRCIVMTKKGGFNWSLSIQYSIINSIHANDYINAWNTFELAKKVIRRMPPNIVEQFNLIEAYLYLLGSTNTIYTNKKYFKINKFLNQVPEATKDKTGANTAILIVQVCILLMKGKRGLIIDKMDSLRKYSNKYFRNGSAPRARNFLKILLQLETSKFHPIAFERKSKPYLTKLLETEMTLSDLEIEIIPYNYLYQVILKQLK